jgi:hypothetical protein
MEYLVNRLLERSAVKVARSVLRGGRWSNPSALPDIGFQDFKEASRRRHLFAHASQGLHSYRNFHSCGRLPHPIHGRGVFQHSYIISAL